MSNLNYQKISASFDNVKIKSKLIFGILFISILSILLTSYLLSSSMSDELENVIFEKSSIQLDNYASQIKESVLFSKDTVLETSSNKEIKEFLSLHESSTKNFRYEELKHSLSQKFVNIMKTNPSFFQVRLLDSNGYEVIKVENSASELQIVPESKLSFKGNRDYFLKSIQSNSGEVFFSEVDLNMENGEIQFPYIPTIRFASPIEIDDGKNAGIFIINVNLETQLLTNPNFFFGSFILIDSQGNFLVHPDSNKLFGNILGHEHNYFLEQPELKTNVSLMDSKIHHDFDEGEFRNWIKVFYNDQNPEDFWVLVNVVPEELLFKPLSNTHVRIFEAIAISLVFAVIATLFLSRTFMQPIKQILNHIAKISSGELDEKLELTRKDEFGKIGNSLNSMMTKLQNSKRLQKKFDLKLNEIIRDLQNYRQALDTSSIVSITDAKGIIREVNDEFCKVSQYSRDELIGMNHRILKSGYHSTKFYQNLWNTIMKGNVWHGDLKNKAKDGSFYWEKKTIIPKFEKDHTPSRFISVSTDITRQKEYEEQLVNHVEELNKTEILKNEFASMVTHELKTPLTPIRGYCEMLKEELVGSLNEEQLECIDTIDSNAFQLESLIGDILDAQKLDMGKMVFDKKNISINEIFSDVKKSFEPLLKRKQITLTILPFESQTVFTDINRTKQVFGNLIRNSIDFVPEIGGEIEIGMTSKDEEIIFFVKDNGKGIPKGKQKKIFKKFYQVDTSQTRKHGGTGLGLAVCKGIMDNLGGKIWFESESGKGTTFYFSITKTLSPNLEI